MSSLGQRNFYLNVGLREISLLSVDFALIPVLVNSLQQRDDVIFLKTNLFQLESHGNFWKYLTLNPSSPGFSGSKSYNAMQHGCCG